jgi:hypothetical protein
MIVKKLLPQEIYEHWESISKLLNLAIPYADGDYSIDQVKLYLTSGHWLVVCGFEENRMICATTISFINMPNDRIAFITLIGGKKAIQKENYNQLKTILKDHKSTKIQGGARPSVARLWKKLGFQERYILVENKL